jgi:hypothetical protein
MGHKELERLIRRIVKEAPVDYGDYPERMDPRVQQKIEDPENIYAKNRGFAGGVSDVERLSGDRFKEIVDYVKRYFGTERNITEPSVISAIQMEQMMAVRQAMMTEPRHREKLRDLAVEIGAKEEGWMPYDTTMEQALRDGSIKKRKSRDGGTIYEFELLNMLTFLGEQSIDPSIFQMKAKENKKLPIPANFSFDIDELTPEEQKQLEIEKRNIINAYVMGKAKRGQYGYQAYKDRLDAIDPSLYPLYNKIMGANDLMYFTNQQLIEMLGGNAAGSAGKAPEPNDDDEDDDQGGESEEKDTWFANGLIFPILLHEVGKAFSMVTTRQQWKGMDPEMARQVISQTDTMENEPMNFRVGAELARKIRTMLPDELVLEPSGRIYMPFFEKNLYEIPAERFLKQIIANVVSNKKEDNLKAVKEFREVFEKAKKEYEKFKGGDDDDDEYDYDEEDDFSY